MRVEFWFDFSCPYAYLGSTQIEAVARRHGADLVWRPLLLGGVFRAVDTPQVLFATLPPPKARHNYHDMMRWAEWFGVPLAMPAAHPMRTVRALRALLALPEARWPAFIHAMYRAYWVRNDDITGEPVVGAALDEAGCSPAERAHALAANDDAGIKAELRRRTDEAIARGVFGVPAMFVGDGADAVMFWGQDRFEFVERALAGWRPGGGQVTA
jgi:2-hydroxychromene-2-carboxylate isomerase